MSRWEGGAALAGVCAGRGGGGRGVRRAAADGDDIVPSDAVVGHGRPILAMGPSVVAAVRRCTRRPIYAHLMITDPAEHAAAFIDAGAAFTVFHSEACKDPSAVIKLIRSHGAKPGLAINPPNPVEKLEPFLEEIDLALVMTVNPGFAGQSFIADVMPKLATLARWKRERDLGFFIEVDGGIGPSQAPLVVTNGGEILVAASAIFGAPDAGAALVALREAGESALA